MNIHLLDPEEINRQWPRLAPILQLAVDEGAGEVALEKILERLALGTELLLIASTDQNEFKGLCVLGVAEFETGKRVLEMPYVAGSMMESWLTDGFEVIKLIAKNLNCTHIRGSGRKGWAKILPELKVIRTVYEYEI